MPSSSRHCTDSRATYHHGNLREALVDAAVQLIEEGGIEKLSVRETAKRAGVSPGAPFRHFPTRTALLTAVAEQATQRLNESVQAALGAVADEPPLRRLAAIGHAYLKWAQDHPTHFKVISDRGLIDYAASQSMRESNQAIQDQMQLLLEQVSQAGASRLDAPLARLASRAMVYGLARMVTDGHFPEWGPRGFNTEQAVGETLDFFMSLMESSSKC